MIYRPAMRSRATRFRSTHELTPHDPPKAARKKRKQNLEPLHVAIVGAGFSGTSVFKQLAENPPEGRPLKLSIIETRAMLGAGMPYGKDNPAIYKVNNHAGKMSIDPEDRDDFRKWLEQNLDRLRETFPDLTADEIEYAPRQVFGLYLQDSFLTAEATARALGMSVEVYRERVSDLDVIDGGNKVKVSFDGAPPLVADRCVFTAQGWTPSPIDHLKESAAVQDGRCTVITQHIPGNEIDELPLDAKVAIVGSSLSALDVVARLFSPATGARFERNDQGELTYIPGPNQRKVTLCSRSGRFPRIRPDNFQPVELKHLTRERVDELFRAGELDLAALARLADKELEAAGVNVDWDEIVAPNRGLTQQEINDKLMATLATEIDAGRGRTPETPDLFLHRMLISAFSVVLDVFENQKLSPEDQARVRRQVEAIYLQYIAASPPETSEMVLALMKAGALEVKAGVRSFDADDEIGCIRIPHVDPSGAEDTLTTHTLINAAGMPERDPHKNGDPLIRSLLDKGVLSAYARDGELMGGVDADPTSMRAIGADGQPSPCLFVLGELLKGRQFLVNATYLLNQLTVRAAQAIREDAALPEPKKTPRKRMRKLIGIAS